MTQHAFFFDQSRCYSCHACSVACKEWYGIEPGPEKWMTVYEWEEGSFLDLKVHSLAFPCAHCENPVCAQACPNNAIFKEKKYGAVLVDDEKCKGCRQCLLACPYGAPKFASDAPGTKMSKCTMCYDRLEKGELPTCVSACPLRAFDFGTLEEIKGRYGVSRQLEGMPDPEITKPNFIVKETDPKKQLVPYDKARALELMQQRGELGVVFDNIEDVTEVSKDQLSRGELRMKHANARDLLAETRNNVG